MYNHLVFRHYPITCHFRKIKTLGSTEPAGIVGGELFGSVTVKFRKCWKLIFDPQRDRPVPRTPDFNQLVTMNVYCFWDKVLFSSNLLWKYFRKSVKNRKNHQKCENENSRKTTKLVIIISNREHTLDVISKAFIFLVMLAKMGIQGPSRDWKILKKFSRILIIYRYFLKFFCHVTSPKTVIYGAYKHNS